MQTFMTGTAEEDQIVQVLFFKSVVGEMMHIKVASGPLATPTVLVSLDDQFSLGLPLLRAEIFGVSSVLPHDYDDSQTTQNVN